MIFVAPVICSYLYYSFIPGEVSTISIPHFILGVSFIDAGHVLATIGPVLRRLQEKRFSLRKSLSWLFLFTITGLVLICYSRLLFYVFVAPIAVAHVTRQQYAWLLISRNRFGENEKGLLLDKIFIWILMLVPVIWWLSPLSTSEKYYFQQNDLGAVFPSWIANFAVVLLIAAVVVYVFQQFRNHSPRNWGKYLILTSTGLWFSSLIVFPERHAFFFALLYIHGVPYILHTQRDYLAAPQEKTLLHTCIRNSWIYLIAIAAFGIAWRHIPPLHDGAQTTPFILIGEFFMFYPLFLHYFFDSFIWRGLRKDSQNLFSFEDNNNLDLVR